MSSEINKYGLLTIYAQSTGDKATRVPLGNSCYTIGSDAGAVIKLIRPEVEPIHCEINVTDDGLASLICKSKKKPIPINGKAVAQQMFLMHKDEFTIMGKRFKYENDSILPAIVEEAKKANTENLRRLKRITAFGRVSMTPQPEKQIHYQSRRSQSADNMMATVNRNKKPFMISTPQSELRPSLRSTTIMKNAIQMNFGEPEIENSPKPSTSNDCVTERSENVKTPVAEFNKENIDDESDINTPLNNTSMILIDTPVDDETPPLRSRKSKAKDIAVQRLTQNDESVVVLESPNSKTPKSALKSSFVRTPKYNFPRSNLLDEFSEAEDDGPSKSNKKSIIVIDSTPASTLNNDSCEVTEISDDDIGSTDASLIPTRERAATDGNIAVESLSDESLIPSRKSNRLASKSFVEELKCDLKLQLPLTSYDEENTPVNLSKQVHFDVEDSTEKDFNLKMPLCSTPGPSKSSLTSIKSHESSVNDDEEEEETEESCSQSQSSKGELDKPVEIGLKRKRESTSTCEDEASRKRLKATSIESTIDEMNSFNSQDYFTENENEMSVLQENEDKLNYSMGTPIAIVPDRKAFTEPRQAKKMNTRRSLSACSFNEVNEPFVEVSSTTVETIDTSSFVYVKNNISIENADVDSPSVDESVEHDLNDVVGVKKLIQTPRLQKEPLNEMSTSKGVMENELSNITLSGIKDLIKTPVNKQKSSDGEGNASDENVASVFNMSGVNTLTNDIDDDDVFPTRKIVRTYGKSPPSNAKPIGRKSSRKLESFSNKTSPDVAAWVEKTTDMTQEQGRKSTRKSMSSSTVDEGIDLSEHEDEVKQASVKKSTRKSVAMPEEDALEVIRSKDQPEVDEVADLSEDVDKEALLLESTDEEVVPDPPVKSTRKSIRKTLDRSQIARVSDDFVVKNKDEVSQESRKKSTRRKSVTMPQEDALEAIKIQDQSEVEEALLLQDTDEEVVPDPPVKSTRKSIKKVSVSNELVGKNKDEVTQESRRKSIKKKSVTMPSEDAFEVIRTEDQSEVKIAADLCEEVPLLEVTDENNVVNSSVKSTHKSMRKTLDRSQIASEANEVDWKVSEDEVTQERRRKSTRRKSVAMAEEGAVEVIETKDNWKVEETADLCEGVSEEVEKIARKSMRKTLDQSQIITNEFQVKSPTSVASASTLIASQQEDSETHDSLEEGTSFVNSSEVTVASVGKDLEKNGKYVVTSEDEDQPEKVTVRSQGRSLPATNLAKSMKTSRKTEDSIVDKESVIGSLSKATIDDIEVKQSGRKSSLRLEVLETDDEQCNDSSILDKIYDTTSEVSLNETNNSMSKLEEKPESSRESIRKSESTRKSVTRKLEDTTEVVVDIPAVSKIAIPPDGKADDVSVVTSSVKKKGRPTNEQKELDKSRRSIDNVVEELPSRKSIRMSSEEDQILDDHVEVLETHKLDEAENIDDSLSENDATPQLIQSPPRMKRRMSTNKQEEGDDINIRSSRKTRKKSLKSPESEEINADDDNMTPQISSARKTSRKAVTKPEQDDEDYATSEVEDPTSARKSITKLMPRHEHVDDASIETPVQIEKSLTEKSTTKKGKKLLKLNLADENSVEVETETPQLKKAGASEEQDAEIDNKTPPILSSKKRRKSSKSNLPDENVEVDTEAPVTSSSSRKSMKKSVSSDLLDEIDTETPLIPSPRRSNRKSMTNLDAADDETVEDTPTESSQFDKSVIKRSRKSLHQEIETETSAKRSIGKSLKDLDKADDKTGLADATTGKFEYATPQTSTSRKSLKSKNADEETPTGTNQTEDSASKKGRKSLKSDLEEENLDTPVSKEKKNKNSVNGLPETPIAVERSASKKIRKSAKLNESNLSDAILDDSFVETNKVRSKTPTSMKKSPKKSADFKEIYLTQLKVVLNKEDTLFKTPKSVANAPRSVKKSPTAQPIRSSKRSLNKSPEASVETGKTKVQKDKGYERRLKKSRAQKEPENDLTNPRGIRKLMETPKPIKEVKNDLTDVKGLKKLMATPKPRKEPKNDLTDPKGLKKLMATPKPRKEPKNDLSDVEGVAALMNLSGSYLDEKEKARLLSPNVSLEQLVLDSSSITKKSKKVVSSPSKRINSNNNNTEDTKMESTGERSSITRNNKVDGKPQMDDAQIEDDETPLRTTRSTRNAKAKKVTDVNTEETEVKNRTRRGQNVEEEPVVPPKKATRPKRGKQAGKEAQSIKDNEEDVEANDAGKEESTKIEIKESAKKPTRGRRGKQTQQEIDGEIDIEVDETPSSIKKPGKGKLTDKKAGKTQMDDAQIEDDETQLRTTRSTRNAKAKKVADVNTEETEVKNRTRSKKRRDDEAVETVPAKRGRRGHNVEEEPVVPPKKATRPKRGKQAEKEAQSIKDNEEDVEANDAGKKESTKIEIKESAKKPTRGRRGKQGQQEIDGEIDIEVDKTPSSTKKLGKGKLTDKMAYEDNENIKEDIETPKPTRATRKAAKDDEDYVQPVKRPRRGKQVDKVDGSTASVEKIVEKSGSEVPVRRGRSKTNSVSAESMTPIRSGKAKPEVEIEPSEELEKVPKKRTRRGQTKTVAQVEETKSKTSAKRGKTVEEEKVVTKTKIIDGIRVSSTISSKKVTFDQHTPMALTPGKPLKRRLKSEEDLNQEALEMPTLRKSARSRK